MTTPRFHWDGDVNPPGNVGFFGQDVATMVNDTGGAVVEGDIVALDAPDATSDYICTKVAKVATADLDINIFGVCLESAGTGENVRVAFRAAATKVLNDTGGATAIAKGAEFGGKNASYGAVAVAAATKVLGIALESIADGATGYCMFNGVEGFGQNHV